MSEIAELGSTGHHHKSDEGFVLNIQFATAISDV
jgi:hypothetical protein